MSRVSREQTEMFPETRVDEGPRAHARGGDPWTSHEAASTVNVPRHRAIVFGAFVAWGRMSDEALVAGLAKRRPQYDITPQSARSRRSELTADGLLHIVGEAETQHRRRCLVYGLTEKGEAEAERRGWRS